MFEVYINILPNLGMTFFNLLKLTESCIIYSAFYKFLYSASGICAIMSSLMCMFSLLKSSATNWHRSPGRGLLFLAHVHFPCDLIIMPLKYHLEVNHSPHR